MVAENAELARYDGAGMALNVEMWLLSAGEMGLWHVHEHD
jgi:hypothetical protein